jgi:hypothetical protein
MVPSPVVNNRGQSLIEVTIGIVVLVPVLLFLTDFIFVLWGVQANDLVCRDAARAAAFGDPVDATARAQAVVESTADRQSLLVSPSILIPPVDVQVSHEPVVQFDPISHREFSPGGPVTGTVTAVTEIEIRPFVMRIFTANTRKLTFRSHQKFPITYVSPVVHPPEQPPDRDGD